MTQRDDQDSPQPANPTDDDGPTISSDGVVEPSDTRPVPGSASAASDDAAAAGRVRITGYRIVGLLGRGGMGEVWEAEQERPRRRVALKVMRRDHMVDPLHERMFQREAGTLARLKHPNIAAIFASGHTDDGRDYFAMELVSGVTLGRWLERQPATVDGDELRLRLRLFETICDAVHYAHQRGVIHRDLKPSNTVVTEESSLPAATGTGAAVPTVKILDFGLARITDADLAATMVSEVGLIKGTLRYMSPEQARGDADAIDLRSDVYALGVILYELLSGKRPYDVTRSALAEAIRVICEEPPRPLAESWSGPGRPDVDLETTVGKALDKDVGRRYVSAAALGEDVGRHLASQPFWRDRRARSTRCGSSQPATGRWWVGPRRPSRCCSLASSCRRSSVWARPSSAVRRSGRAPISTRWWTSSRRCWHPSTPTRWGTSWLPGCVSAWWRPPATAAIRTPGSRLPEGTSTI